MHDPNFLFRQRAQTGFTIVELMVAITVLAVLLGIGVPSFRLTLQGNRITTTANDMVAALQFARSEAVRRGVNVTLCSSGDQATCSGTWANGWIVRGPDPADPPFRVWPAVRPDMALAAGGNVEFNPLGGVTNPRCFQFDLGTFRRSVSIGPGGRVSTTPNAC